MSQTTDARRAVDVRRLRAAVRGVVITPADAGYEELRAVGNAATAARPAAIVQATVASDVAATLAFATGAGLSVSVRDGGQRAARNGSTDLMIDLASLRGVVVDRDARTAAVRGGEICGGVDAATLPYDLAAPTARWPRAGVVGAVRHAAAGWLSPRHGLINENVRSAEVVTPEGNVITVAGEPHPEQLGVVTSLRLALHPVPPLVYGGVLLFRPADAPEVMAVLDRLREHGEFAGLAALLVAPPVAFVPGNVVGHPVLAVVPAWIGNPTDGAHTTSGLRAVPALVDTTAPMPYAALQNLFEHWSAVGDRRACATAHLSALSPLSALLDDLGAELPPGSCVALAAAGRGRAWHASIAACWTAADDDAAHTDWVTSTAARLPGRNEELT